MVRFPPTNHQATDNGLSGLAALRRRHRRCDRTRGSGRRLRRRTPNVGKSSLFNALLGQSGQSSPMSRTLVMRWKRSWMQVLGAPLETTAGLPRQHRSSKQMVIE